MNIQLFLYTALIAVGFWLLGFFTKSFASKIDLSSDFMLFFPFHLIGFAVLLSVGSLLYYSGAFSSFWPAP